MLCLQPNNKVVQWFNVYN